MNEWGLTAGITEDIAEVGSAFTGEVHRDLDTGSSTPIRGVRILLRLRVSGQGDTDDRDVSGLEIETDDNGRISNRFELPVPVDGPVSYEGRLMRVQWSIEVRIDVKRRRDSAFEFPVLVVPRGGYGAYTGAHPLRW